MNKHVDEKILELAEIEGKGLEELTYKGKIGENEVERYEKENGIKFPKQYREFLIRYGSMDFGFEVKGCFIDNSGKIRFDRDEDFDYYYGDLGMSLKYSILKDVDEFAYVIDLESGEVYDFGKFEKGEEEYIHEYKDFNSYLCDMIEDYIINIES